LERRRS